MSEEQPAEAAPPPILSMTSPEVRTRLVEVLELDLIGPSNDHAFAHELLKQSPRRWYLTGYLVPKDAPKADKQSGDETDEEDISQPFVNEAPRVEDPKVEPPNQKAPGGADDDNSEASETPSRLSFLPSSMGLSVLLPKGNDEVEVTVRWGDYLGEVVGEGEEQIDEKEVNRAYEEDIAKDIARTEIEEGARVKEEPEAEYKTRRGFRRDPREEVLQIQLTDKPETIPLDVPNSRGLKIHASWRPLSAIPGSVVGEGTRLLSVFIVNERRSEPITYRDFAFQVEVELTNKTGFLGRPDLRGLALEDESDQDDRIADLHYRDVLEYTVGHGVSTTADEDGVSCRSVRTCWIPSGEVPRTDHAGKKSIGKTEISMEALGELEDGEAAKKALQPLVESYRAWIEVQEKKLSADTSLTSDQRDTALELIMGAKVAADRIKDGVAALADPVCLEAFRIANRSMGRAIRKRLAVQQGIEPSAVKPPEWRVFQLAFILTNLRGLFDPEHPSRKTVDLLFFPTGGGKTEAYLGLAAFTLVMRRLRNKGISSAGVSIIMRYTLRLLTLDQLGRAAALMCALELERAKNKALGEWPFEIGLWVGSAATPNRMGKRADKGGGKEHTAYTKLSRYSSDSQRYPAPIPIEECPWCSTLFEPDSFQLKPDGAASPTDLLVSCVNEKCEFSSAHNAHLPIVGVDEPLYRRLPCFIIATVDKFAALPWMGRVGGLFGKVDRYDSEGFYGACDTDIGAKLPNGQLDPPDLIIQDELHLISGPLGTVAGIYETAIEKLCSKEVGEDGVLILPKIIASTATVRRADRQIRALFGRQETAIFPPPGPSRDDSFFAKTVHSSPDSPGRLYLGISAQGRSMKVVYLRAALAILGSAMKLYKDHGGWVPNNPCDPYMTLLCYFNSLRELGGSRRIVEDEFYSQAENRYKRHRYEPDDRLFLDRWIKRFPVELTSRVGTNAVARAKRQLDTDFSDKKNNVDVALATNMISVGLDITRLGLMVVYGQPKTSSEYIQATSRVGRDPRRPGLVLTLLNQHKPRDRSHYERFEIYHRTFYRAVEATSVTPFSPRALDRALSGAMVGLCRQSSPTMQKPFGAGNVGSELAQLQDLVRVLAERGRIHDVDLDPAEQQGIYDQVDELTQGLLGAWCSIATITGAAGESLGYQKHEGKKPDETLIRDPLDQELQSKPDVFWKFRANRSMRDVEAPVDILPEKLKTKTSS